jgi:hypothetical protein
MTRSLGTDNDCRFSFRMSFSRYGCHLYVILDMKVRISARGRYRLTPPSLGIGIRDRRCETRPPMVLLVKYRPKGGSPGSCYSAMPWVRSTSLIAALLWRSPGLSFLMINAHGRP